MDTIDISRTIYKDNFSNTTRLEKQTTKADIETRIIRILDILDKVLAILQEEQEDKGVKKRLKKIAITI